MSHTGKYAECVYDNGSVITYEYVYINYDTDVSSNPVIFDGAINNDALIPDADDVSFVSAYQII